MSRIRDPFFEKFMGGMSIASLALVAVTVTLLALFKSQHSEYIIFVMFVGIAGFGTSVALVGWNGLAVNENRIDAVLENVLRTTMRIENPNLKQFTVLSHTLPAYRFVDLFQAIERYCESVQARFVVESMHVEDLTRILQSQLFDQDAGQLTQPRSTTRDVACNEQKFFPVDRFWVVRHSGTTCQSGVAILRLREMYNNQAAFEVAGEQQAAEPLVEAILKDSVSNSVYRGQLLSVRFEPKVDDQYGEVEARSPIQLNFLERRPILPEDIVIDDGTHETLQRTVFNFYAQRDELQRLGVPLRRGLLFHGPPGTGKSYMCQYISGKLEGITTLLVTGHSLINVKEICSLARLFQPSLVVLEDVDLVFSSREINLYSSALGELMDELDGFQQNDSVIFLLTTNSIERLEAAVKDRPGRINQCIRFDPPTAELRERYIRRYVRPYDTGELEYDALVKKTGDTSQAFLKELVFRAVQVSLETPSENGDRLKLRNEHFDVALNEMTRHGSRSTGAIMGFKSSDR